MNSASQPPEALARWVAEVKHCERGETELILIAGDASPRRYFRAQYQMPHYGATTEIAVSSPPTEKNEAFLSVRLLLEAAGIRAPRLIAASLEHGYFLLEDFGDRLLSHELAEGHERCWYPKALDVLNQLAKVKTESAALPAYDRQLLIQEMDLFPEWFLKKLLGLSESEIDQARLGPLWALLVANAEAQPQVVVHRDFHCRNLMCLSDGQLGIIDFQDAVIGPVTYDLVSLLKDCYVVWPREIQLAWLQNAFDSLTHAGHLSVDVEFPEFIRWFDLMGLQRHIKVLGIFARLHLRDNKPSYLTYLRDVLTYVGETLALYRGKDAHLEGFADWFDTQLVPKAVAQSWYTAEEG